jgi:hypothetical protein
MFSKAIELSPRPVMQTSSSLKFGIYLYFGTQLWHNLLVNVEIAVDPRRLHDSAGEFVWLEVETFLSSFVELKIF